MKIELQECPATLTWFSFCGLQVVAGSLRTWPLAVLIYVFLRWHKPSCQYHTSLDEVAELPKVALHCPECQRRASQGDARPCPSDANVLCFGVLNLGCGCLNKTEAKKKRSSGH